MKPLKLILLLLTFNFAVPQGFAIIASSSTQTMVHVSQQQLIEKKKPFFLEKQRLKKALNKTNSEGTADAVTAIISGILSIVFFAITASANGLIESLISTLLFGTLGIVFGVLCVIFLIRWAVRSGKKTSS